MPEVSEREYFERVLNEIEKRFDDRLAGQALRFEERFTAQALALQLQAGANDIRVAALNVEQARLSADRERFLPRELWDTKLGEIEKWREGVNAQTVAISSRRGGVNSVWAIGAIAISALTAIMSVIFVLFRR